MDTARLERIQDLFFAALERPEAAREAFLEAACSGDPALREAVLAYLEADAAEGAFLLDEPLVRLLPADEPDEASGDGADVSGRRVGPYRLVRLLGRGGMGAVYLAEREDVGRRVALKVVRGDLADPDARRRFLLERRVLGRLEHPHIARLYDVGVAEDGTPYFAMEYVEGVPLTDYCDRERLPVEARLRLFEAVGRAVQHAHQHFVVHRDLKPSNVLVTADEAGRPVVKLLDFGVAKVLAEAGEVREDEPLTGTGQQLLTPAYAAPEQVTGGAVTAATDVYALGVVLYELLTGRRPHEVDDPTTQAVLTQDPKRPSTAVTEARDTDTVTAEARRTTPDRLARRLRGDLDVICLKALQKEPERRYASAEAFVEDVRRHLAGLPVAARPDATGYRLRKFVRRHRRGVWASAAAVLVLALVVGFYTARLQAERDRARAEAEKAERVSAFLADLFGASNPFLEVQGDTLTALDLLERGAARVDRELAGEPEVQATMLAVIGGVFYRIGRYDEAEPLMERALALRREILGPEHPDVAASLHDLGWLHVQRGDYAAADSLARASLALYRRQNERVKGLGEALTLAGTTRYFLGDYPAADSLYRASYDLNLALLGPDAPLTITGLRDLGHVATVLGDRETALRYAHLALDGYRRAYGDLHPLVASAINDVGYLEEQRGNYEAAEQLYRETLAMDRLLGGDGDGSEATSANNLGAVLIKLGAYEEADALLLDALGVFRRLDHPYATHTLRNLARSAVAQGDYDAALAYQREALATARRFHGDEHPNVAASHAGLGDVLLSRGDPRSAERAYREALAMERRFRGEKHERVGQAMNNVAAALIGQGRYAEAEPLLHDALAMFRELLEEGSPETAPPLRNLGRLMKETGRFERGESYLLEALRIQQTKLDDGHPDLAKTRAALAELYDAWGRPEEAAAYRTQEQP